MPVMAAVERNIRRDAAPDLGNRDDKFLIVTIPAGEMLAMI